MEGSKSLGLQNSSYWAFSSVRVWNCSSLLSSSCYIPSTCWQMAWSWDSSRLTADCTPHVLLPISSGHHWRSLCFQPFAQYVGKPSETQENHLLFLMHHADGSYLAFASVECLTLVVMSYDRFVAICHPCNTQSSWAGGCARSCIACWVCGFSLAIVQVSLFLRCPSVGPRR